MHLHDVLCGLEKMRCTMLGTLSETLTHGIQQKFPEATDDLQSSAMSESCHVKIITRETMANTVLGNETTPPPKKKANS